jgi:WD40 repeat protein
MRLSAHIKIVVTASLSFFVICLEHHKSFLVQDGSSNVNCIAMHHNSLLISNSNDVIQKDVETGALQRTFRAHQNVIYSFVVTEDSRMIASAFDDMISVWSLETGSMLRKFWARSNEVQIQSVIYSNDKVVFGGGDRRIRQMDLVTGQILKSFGKSIIMLST